MATIRLATTGDAVAIAAIYAPYCDATGHLVRRGGAQLAKRWRGVLRRSARLGRGSCSKAPAARARAEVGPREHLKKMMRVSSGMRTRLRITSARRIAGPSALPFTSTARITGGAPDAPSTRHCSLCSGSSATDRPPPALRCRTRPASGCTTAFGFAPVGVYRQHRLQDGRLARRRLVSGRDTARIDAPSRIRARSVRWLRRPNGMTQ